MELIQNWTLDNKNKLKKYIISLLKDDYKDIVIVGSRIFGGFKPTSDIDIVVFMDNCPYTIYDRIRGYFDEVPNEDSPYNNFRINIAFADYSNFKNHIWESAGYSLLLPKYSIIHDIYHEGNKNHITLHQKLRKLIYDCNGINVPFDQFKKENKHLI